MWKPRIQATTAFSLPYSCSLHPKQYRTFHDYFVAHLPSTSLHPDSRSPSRPNHKLPRHESTPHQHKDGGRSPATMVGHARDTTVFRIPLKSAKHHFGASLTRGTRPYNEDAYQAGTIELPAFAKRAPVSLTSKRKTELEGTSAESASGDPQVFYFGVFDGHGGDDCSTFLREKLHDYVEQAARQFQLESTLKKNTNQPVSSSSNAKSRHESSSMSSDEGSKQNGSGSGALPSIEPGQPSKQSESEPIAEELERDLVRSWKETVGGYFRRFKPQHFSTDAGGHGEVLSPSKISESRLEPASVETREPSEPIKSSIANVLTYSFLRADLDFVTDQASKTEALNDPETPKEQDETPTEEHENPHVHHRSETHHADSTSASAPKQFLGGSTCSVALVSTPSTTPFWHPSSPCTVLIAHCGDTRIILCATSSGAAVPLTHDHHPSLPKEATRLRRYAGAFTTDSFGEERISGLANTRAFGDTRSKRLGVSAEPELTILHLKPAEAAFLVLVSDGVSGILGDQDVADIVKEAKTPDQASRDVTAFATEVSGGEKGDADNATCLVVRMGGWERRGEGGKGSLGTKENRDWRRQSASDPRAGRM